ACVFAREAGPPRPEDEGKYIYVDFGGFRALYFRYLIFENGSFRVIENRSELAKLYQPIDSEEKAFAYALTATGLSEKNEREYAEGASITYTFMVSKVPAAHVKHDGDNFVVNLFAHAWISGPEHSTYENRYLVTPDAKISLVSEREVYQVDDG